MITKEAVIEKIKEVKDPEIGVDLWTLGLIYDIKIDEEGVEILMTLTTAFCPFADKLVLQVEDKVKELIPKDDELQTVRVELTFTPPWVPSPELRARLGL
jgi:metal-sulfur cluster biosynthetic enzyme